MEFYEPPAADGGAGSDETTVPFQYAEPVEAYSRPWPVPIRAQNQSFCPHGCVYFDEEFLKRFDINPVRCAVIEVRDSSMAPTLPVGSVCLADRRRTAPEEGKIYAVERRDTLLVRRARRRRQGWVLEADSQDYLYLTWDDDIVPIGLIIWTARMIDADIAARPALVVATP